MDVKSPNITLPDSTFENLPEAVAQVSPDGVLKYANSSFLDFIQIPEGASISDGITAWLQEQAEFIKRKISPLRPQVNLESQPPGMTTQSHNVHWSGFGRYSVESELTEIIIIGHDYIDRGRLFLEVNRRLELSNLIMALATRFIRMPKESIDEGILKTLRTIGQYAQADRSYIYLIDSNSDSFSNTHEWCAPGIESLLDIMQQIPLSVIPWGMKKLSAQETIQIDTLAELPADAKNEKEFWKDNEIKSVLITPLTLGKEVRGWIGYETVKDIKHWNADQVILLQFMSDIIINALERKWSEEHLQHSTERNLALISGIPDMIFRMRSDGTLLDFSMGDEPVMELNDEDCGKPLSSFLPADIAARFKSTIKQALSNRRVNNLDFDLTTSIGTQHYEARVVVSGVDETLAIIRNVSERVRLEQIKSDFINRATHELRTPLTTALLMVDLLESSQDPIEQEKYWRILRSELDRQRILVEDLLSASRLEKQSFDLDRKKTEINPILQTCMDTIQPLTEQKKIKLVAHFCRDNPTIMGDDRALQQVFNNLLGNAVKFTPDKGLITITCKKESEWIEISISDTGFGIPSEDMKHLFSRFFRARNAVGSEIPGSGIGLFLVKSLVESMDGIVEVESQEGKGSTFSVKLHLTI
jgi:signal transduction histidine kinase